MAIHSFTARLLEPGYALAHAEYCGRTCWKSDAKADDTTRKFLSRIIKAGHTSVLEHVGLLIGSDLDFSAWKHAYPVDKGYLVNARTLLAMCEHGMKRPVSDDRDINEFLDIVDEAEMVTQYRPTFEIVCDRAVSHEFVRHRVSVFSQESQRYVKYDDGVEIVINPGLEPDVKGQIIMSASGAFADYQGLRKAGVQPQIARSVLPNCCYTKLVVSSWMWEWDWFLQLRDDKAAHPDMRLIAGQIRDQLVAYRDLEKWQAKSNSFESLRQISPRFVIELP